MDALIAYGWIDGIHRKLNDERTMQLISPMKTQSLSSTYHQRLERLELEERMKQPGCDEIEQCNMLSLWEVMQDVDNMFILNDLQILLDEDCVAVI